MIKNICFTMALILSCISFGGKSVSADPLFTKDDVKKFSPRSRDELVDVLVDNQESLRKADITTRLRLAHFFAQVATETGGIRRIDENMNYSFEKLLEVFSRQTISEAKAREIAGKPREIANWVYGNKNGNWGRNTEDGWNYRGSGFIQLTGRGNFRKRGAEVGMPFEKNPELARQPIPGLRAATAYWSAYNINRPSDDNDIDLVRRIVNGPAKRGLPEAKIWYLRAWKIFRGSGHVETEGAVEAGGITGASDETALMNAVAEALENLDFIPSGVVESGSLTNETFTESLRKYQKSRGLQETGEMDEDTLYSITDPQEWRRELSEDTSYTINDPDSSVSFNILPESEPPAAISLEPNQGSGTTVSDSNLSQEEIAVLSESDAAYSLYEMAGGKRKEDDTLIPFSVIGNDDRVAVLNTKEFPARAVVQITFNSKSSGESYLCSGAMISSDTVLTAGHCVHKGTRTGDWFTNFKVYPGRNTGLKPFGSCGVKKVFALKGWVDAVNSDDARYYDLGALKLDREIGANTGWFGIRAPEDSEINLPTTVHGYAGDKTPAGRQWISKDHIRVLQSLKGFYQNDTYGGTSGSPVYSGEDYHIIGVHTNGLHNGEQWKINNAFTRITHDRLNEIFNWIHNRR